MMGFKPTIFGETIRHVNHYTTHPYLELSVRFELTRPFGSWLQSKCNRPLYELSIFLLRMRDSNPRHLLGGLAYETSEIDHFSNPRFIFCGSEGNRTPNTVKYYDFSRIALRPFRPLPLVIKNYL